jgi:hypothetical protein
LIDEMEVERHSVLREKVVTVKRKAEEPPDCGVCGARKQLDAQLKVFTQSNTLTSAHLMKMF